MVSMADPVREEVPQAMLEASAAHIKVNIVTGDFAEITQEIDPNAQLDRALLGDFVTSCALGTCHGKNVYATKEALRQFIKNHK